MVAKGIAPGPTLAITAAVHGNELNGIPIVQRVFKELDNEKTYKKSAFIKKKLNFC